MFALMHILTALLGLFLRPAITTVKLNPDPIGGVEQDGALVPNGALLTALGALQLNASPVFGNWTMTLVASSLTANTIPGGNLVGGIIKRFAPTAAFTDCTDTATNIVLAIPGAKVNQTFPVFIANLGSAANANTMTLAGGTGVTVSGTATINTNCVRLFLGQVTGSGAVSLTSAFQFGLGITTGL